MYLWFYDSAVFWFFLAVLGYAFFVNLATFIPSNKHRKPHHYQVGFLVLIGCFIALIFLKFFGHRDVFVGTFWACLITGTASIIIDWRDLHLHTKNGVQWVRSKKNK